MTVYLDIILLENICMNYIILLATGLINKLQIKHIRLIISSLIGGIYAIISFMPILEIYSNIIFKIILSIVMIYVSFKPSSFKKLLKILVIFYLTSFAFGGCSFALLYFVKPQEIFMKNGVYIGTYPIKIALLGGVVGFTVIVIAFKIIKGKLSPKNMFCNIEIFYKGKSEKMKAMIDTGNLLKDPITKIPVVVVESASLGNIVPIEILENVQKIIGGEFANEIEDLETQEFVSRFRVIPFSSLGKQHGLLLGFKSDGVKVYYDENEKNIKNIIIGIYEKELSKNKNYSALIGLDMLGEFVT